MKLSKKGNLVAPDYFWHLTPKQKEDLCNGCGPQGNFFHQILSWGVPDNLIGLDISEACNIHDFCWSIDMARKSADNLFLDNMSSLIDAVGGPLLGVRHWMAFHYYLAVKGWKK